MLNLYHAKFASVNKDYISYCDSPCFGLFLSWLVLSKREVDLNVIWEFLLQGKHALQSESFTESVCTT